MLDAYATKVLRAYNDKKAAGSLSPNLSSSTPARLKDECMMVLAQRHKPGDEKLLRMIFGYRENIDAYLKAIDKKTDKFRPLNYFLGGKTTDPDERVIDLLALLIGFEPRPVITGYVVNTGKNETGIVTGKTETTTEKPEKKRAKNAAMIITVALFICLGSYLLLTRSTPKVTQSVDHPIRGGKYMYWIGDHYLAIPVYQVHGDTPVVPLDTQVLNHLKKITDTNSINYNSIGKVWYARLHKNNYEYFTDSGFHPIDTAIRLRRVTRFIIDNHISNHKN
jgi:hypothetical protein